MSWTEKLKNGLEITTGDGKKWFPLYKLNPKSTDFNVSEFEFPNIAGTLVKRSLVKGTRFKLEFYFQGEDHLDQSQAFEQSAKDKRPFVILHPFFGKMTVQPTALEYDPTGLNITKITGDFVETISDEYPRILEDPKNKIAFDFENTQTAVIDSFVANVQPTSSDAVIIKNNNDNIYSLGAESVKSGDQANEYFQVYKKANSAVTKLAADTSTAANLIISLYVSPSLFVDGVRNRLNLLFSQLDSISTDIENLTTFNEKTIFEMSGAAIISSMINTTINPDETDFQNSNEVFETISMVLNSWDSYLNNLQSLQTETNDEINSYIPDFDSMNELIGLVNYGTANLLNIALNAKSERSIILDCDSNAILLAHRFYGLDEGDAILNRFINENQLSKNELIEIKKGKKIIYYI